MWKHQAKPHVVQNIQGRANATNGCTTCHRGLDRTGLAVTAGNLIRLNRLLAHPETVEVQE
jgi:hypothetical protein